MAGGFGKLGWFVGILSGTLFGVLFAPRKGKELRAEIKADRKKGKLGIGPLQDDLKEIGREMVGIARDIYESKEVQHIVEVGRSRVKGLSDDFVEGVSDFHVQRIEPIRKEFTTRIEAGKTTLRRANQEFVTFKKKVKQSAQIGKRAAKQIKKIVRGH